MNHRRSPEPSLYGRIGVAFGGRSRERDVSLESGRRTYESLCRSGFDAILLDGVPAVVDAVRSGHVARVFNCLHGEEGENGALQGFLSLSGIPCTGPALVGCAVSFNKVIAKKIWTAAGIRTPAFALVAAVSSKAGLTHIPFPWVLKPLDQGGSLGVTLIESAAAFEAWCSARELCEGYFVEEFIPGLEISVTVVGNHVLPSVGIKPSGPIFDNEAKYSSSSTTFSVPALAGPEEECVLRFAREAFQALDCSDWGRIDLLRDRDGELWAIEVDSAPGLTSRSLAPKAAAGTSWTFDRLVIEILSTTLDAAAR